MEYRVTRETRETDELMHYGVKGMKWGVRRAIANKAKVAATLERSEKYYNKKANKYLMKNLKSQNKRRKKLEKQGKTLDGMTDKEKKYAEQYISNKKMAIEMNAYRAHAVKDLSEKDIKQGRRWIVKATALTGLPIAVNRRERRRAEQYISENF